jgi:hypothetical protein
MSYYVYVWFRPWNGQPCYVGKGKNKRCYEFKRSHNRHLKHIVNKAGGELPCVIVRDGLEEQEAYIIEMALIAAIGRGKEGPLVNTTDGGRGINGMKFSKALRKHLSELKHILYSDETKRRNVSRGTKAALANPEVRKRISEAQKKRFAEQGPTRGTTGMKFSNRKKTKKVRPPVSDETRKKLSEWQIGRKMSVKARKNMSAARIRYLDKHPEFTKQLSEAGKMGAAKRWNTK